MVTETAPDMPDVEFIVHVVYAQGTAPAPAAPPPGPAVAAATDAPAPPAPAAPPTQAPQPPPPQPTPPATITGKDIALPFIQFLQVSAL